MRECSLYKVFEIASSTSMTMPSKVHFTNPPVTQVSRQLFSEEERVIYSLEDHLLRCGTCVASSGRFCIKGGILVEDVEVFVRRARDGDFYSTRREHNTPVRLEISETGKHLLSKALARPVQRSTVRVIYRRVEQYRWYSILKIDRIIHC